MQEKNIIRAWKDEEYRQSLSEDERALLPPHPAGIIELTDRELGAVAGGTGVEPTYQISTLGCCSWINHECGTTFKALTFGCCPVEPVLDAF